MNSRRFAIAFTVILGSTIVASTSLLGWSGQPAPPTSDEARTHLVAAIAASDSGPQAGLLRRVRLTHAMRHHLERAAELAPGDPDVLGELARFHLAAPGILGGNIGKAREIGEQLSTTHPARGHVILAWVAHHSAERRVAERHFLAAIDSAPGMPEAYLGLGHLYADADRGDDAVRLLSRGLELRPDYRLGYMDLAVITAQTGTNLEVGETAIRRYLEMPHRPGEPPEHAARFRLGMILEKRGRTDEARVEYEAALRLRPSDVDFHRAVRRLR